MCASVLDLFLCLFLFLSLHNVQVQAEVKKAWLRRSLAIDLKQKARVNSSAGCGSGYYGGMMSHTTTQSVCLSVSGTKGLPLGTIGAKGQSRLHNSGNLPGYAPHDIETVFFTVRQHELVLRQNDGKRSPCKQTSRNAEESEHDFEPYFVADDEHSGSMSWKELETMLWWSPGWILVVFTMIRSP